MKRCFFLSLQINVCNLCDVWLFFFLLELDSLFGSIRDTTAVTFRRLTAIENELIWMPLSEVGKSMGSINTTTSDSMKWKKCPKCGMSLLNVRIRLGAIHFKLLFITPPQTSNWRLITTPMKLAYKWNNRISKMLTAEPNNFTRFEDHQQSSLRTFRRVLSENEWKKKISR